jgi:hypothetical protein
VDNENESDNDDNSSDEYTGNDDDDDDEDDDDDDEEDENDDEDGENDEAVDEDKTADENENQIPEINIPGVTLSAPASDMRENTGVENGRENAGVVGTNDNMRARNIGVGGTRETPTRPNDRFFHDTRGIHKHMNQQLMDNRYRPRTHGINLQDWKPRTYDHLYDSDHMLVTFDEPMGELFLTEQMSLKKGLKYFGKSGANAVVKECRQLDYRDMINKLIDAKSLT